MYPDCTVYLPNQAIQPIANAPADFFVKLTMEFDNECEEGAILKK